MDSFFEDLHITKWNKLSKSLRLEAIQLLENHYAQLQGRDPCEIDNVEKGNDSLGYHLNRKIYLNHDLLLGEDDCYLAVYTVLHEGRHDFQTHAAIDSSLNKELSTISQDELYTWKVNISGGYLNQQPDYWFQPIEVDANEYALAEMDQIYSRLKPLLGENIGYKEFKKDLERYLKLEETRFKKTYGKNYLQTVETKVHKKYVLMQTALRSLGNNGYRLHGLAEQYVHQTYPKEILYKYFNDYLSKYIQEKGYSNLDDYLNQEKIKPPSSPEFYGEFQLHEKILPPLMSSEMKSIEKMEQAYEKLIHLRKQIDPLGGKEINQKLEEQMQRFNKKVQSDFQKQYPDVQLKPFYLSMSKIAIDIMKHNHLTGEKLDLHNGKGLGFKQSDLNKLMDRGKEMEMEM